MKNCSILHVEDDPDDVFFVSDALRRAGIESPVDVASDGQSAVDFLIKASERANDPQPLHPCLVLLDLNLPRKNGFEVLKWIRQESPWRTLIVIVLTSSTSDEDMSQAYTLGANAYIIKPSDATKLREFAQLVKQFWLGWNQWPPMRTAGGIAEFRSPRS